LTQFDQELPVAKARSSPEYAAVGGDILRVFFFGRDEAEAEFRDRTTAIRQSANIGTAYIYDPTRIFALRGAPPQIAQVAALLGQ
jgi:hypothetical protein